MNVPTRILIVLLALAPVWCAGCYTFPRIDPTGQHIFAPGSTVITPPTLGCGLFPRPAFVTPPDPLVCAPAMPPQAFAPNCPPPGMITQGPIMSQGPPLTAGPVIGQPIFPASGNQGAALTVTPEQVVAPIGGEVVMVATLGRGDGSVLGKAPVQWSLQQGSVGSIQTVGGADGTTTGKVSESQAVGATAMASSNDDRGTPNSEDDVQLQPGQHWISLRSEVEGASRATVSAAGATGWDGQSKTAVVYWIDAQWSLPSPAIANPGQPHTLTTVLSRPTTGAPIAGWLVRYEITGGSAAGFGPGRQGGAEIASDENGEASVQIFPSGQGGRTQVRILILRPGVNADEPSRLLIGEGATSVTWSAPGLDVQMTGPSQAGVGASARYVVEVSNPGSTTARKVVLTDILPPELTLLDSTPAHQVFGEENRWELGDISAGDSRTVEIQCRTQRRGDLNYCVKARSEGGLERESCVSTRIFAPSLGLDMTGPETATVGQQVQYRITISNTGTDTLRNVLMNDVFTPGWIHAQGETSPMAVPLGDLAPGDVKRIGLTFVVQQPGKHCHTLEVIAGDGQKETRQACVVASQAVLKPSVKVEITGPQTMKTGESGVYRLQINNTGDTALTNLQVTHEYGLALTPVQATNGHRQSPQGGALNWTLPQLPAGGSTFFEAELKATRAQDPVLHRLSVTTDQQVQDAASLTARITAPPAPAPVTPAPAPTQPEPLGPVSGELKVTIADFGDPVKVNAKKAIIYHLELFNDRNVTDREVQLAIELPPGLKFEELGGPARFQRLDGNTILLAPIREMRAQERMTGFRVEATATEIGQFTVKATVRSQRSPQGVVAEQETTAVAQ
ncbi:DUF11 domain-containing protein [Lignipirellula cremea]|uniref:Large cysteine-rich periplasmic protein OmcB, serovars L1/L3 n=1 Tax=Lignipirellula cremea TaxID=2528010 RepID=A0A518DX78_9BACT|nr:DUF11 domain-containing protein [Lignipirellula cremea]QDU96443.1 Large cysteine-rich periplasmic protein OmcB, serovars L1/L3 precursor [Lignipirellula cremea]